jgi:Adenine-specific methyltransferase EcoRI
MANSNLTNARNAKNDEFYTQYHDIQKEISAYLEFNPDIFRGKTVLLPCDDPEWSNFTKFFAQNFEQFGLKKLISTSYAPDSKNYKIQYQPTLFESNDPQFDESKTVKNGKIFTLTHDKSGDGKIDVNDLEWHYLEGGGDFKSDEIKKLRDESDIIITNPPFSLFREFLAWIVEADKQFVIIGNINAITYKELFPLIQGDKIWLGATNFNTGMYFRVSSDFVYSDTYKFEREKDGVKVNRVPGVCWFTNFDHGKRNLPKDFMSIKDNFKFAKHKEMKGKDSYDRYDNYDAIEVPLSKAIPKDYDGIMGVPITFLDIYCPQQFEIIWQASGNTRASAPKEILERLNYRLHPDDRGGCTIVNGNRTYGRILIKHKKIEQ